MKVRPLSRDEVRGIDARAAEDLGLPTLVLMENAGRGAADWLRGARRGRLARVLILCGPGNNGGDGGVVARHLDAWGSPSGSSGSPSRPPPGRRGHPARTSSPARGSTSRTGSPAAPTRTRPAGSTRCSSGADWVVDGLLGTGLTRHVEGTLRVAIEAINRSGKPVLALDLPSGLDADTGRPLGAAVRARATATFVAPKLGFAAPGAGDFTGEVAVVDIGVPRCLLEPFRAP